jgi:hypothetical protein
MVRWCLILILAFGSLLGCSTPLSPVERIELAHQMAVQQAWQAQAIVTKDFVLQAFWPRRWQVQSTAVVYLEGDGLAWLSANMPSSDPTPTDPIALRLALAHPSGQAIYLARPCQFLLLENFRCQRKYWTNGRFSPEVVASLMQALDLLKSQLSVQSFILVGYSGGGTLAALLAARRQDVLQLLTISSVFDTVTWSDQLRLTPLNDSHNPIIEKAKWAHIPQRHLVGDHDRVIPASFLYWQQSQLYGPNIDWVVLPGFTHQCCWVAVWPQNASQWLALPGSH